MSFIIETHSVEDLENIKYAYKKYYKYLSLIKTRIPGNAYNFAIANWHYNPKDHQCPHDSWLESLSLEEASSGQRSEKRELNIKICLLGAYHDGNIELIYSDVFSYSLEKFVDSSPNKSDKNNRGHGDWLKDEIRLSDLGLVLHEILFSNNSRWIIECKNITYSWKPWNSDSLVKEK